MVWFLCTGIYIFVAKIQLFTVLWSLQEDISTRFEVIGQYGFQVELFVDRAYLLFLEHGRGDLKSALFSLLFEYTQSDIERTAVHYLDLLGDWSRNMNFTVLSHVDGDRSAILCAPYVDIWAFDDFNKADDRSEAYFGVFAVDWKGYGQRFAYPLWCYSLWLERPPWYRCSRISSRSDSFWPCPRWSRHDRIWKHSICFWGP